jgi:hypothetical protein
MAIRRNVFVAIAVVLGLQALVMSKSGFKLPTSVNAGLGVWGTTATLPRNMTSNGVKESHNASHLFGFYYQVYKKPKATLEVVKSIRTFMPYAPLYLLSSAGYHYDPLVTRFAKFTKYEYSQQNANINQGEGLSIWLERLKRAAVWCDCDYLVTMEDDTYLHKPLIEAPPDDAGGVTAHLWTHRWTDELRDRFDPNRTWSYESHGLCGGSYVRVSAFLDAYGKTNWSRIEEMGTVWSPIGRYNDVTLAIIMMDAGYRLQPWDNLKQPKGGKRARQRQENHDTALTHGLKHFYRVPLTEEDGPVVLENLTTVT